MTNCTPVNVKEQILLDSSLHQRIPEMGRLGIKRTDSGRIYIGFPVSQTVEQT